MSQLDGKCQMSRHQETVVFNAFDNVMEGGMWRREKLWDVCLLC